MTKRKFKNSEEENTLSSLRRSSRLHCERRTHKQNPRTSNPAETRSGRPDSFSSPLTKIKETSHGVLENKGGKETQLSFEGSRNGCRRSARTQHRTNLEKQYAKEKPQTRSAVGGCRSVRGSEKYVEGSRRSERRDMGANVGKSDEVVMEKRVTRSLGRRNKVVVLEISDSDSEEDSDESVEILSKNVGEIEKRATRSSGKTCMNEACNVSDAKSAVSYEVEPKGDTSMECVNDGGVVRRIGEQNYARKARVVEKRKRDGVEEECGTARGWSKDQEFALQRAYFTAKPTPRFWKKVARMVPGKTAEECFDRIHSDHSTPPPPRTRSRAKIKDPSPLSFSASYLLGPAATKSGRVGIRRTLAAQKTIRHILLKQQKEDQDHNADLFAILEPTISPVPLQEGATFVSPASSKACSVLAQCRQMPSSSLRKHVSRLDSLQKEAFTSPPVLKQIKNKALHEKYIDQLHCRDAKRKAEELRNSRNAKDQIDEKVNHLEQNLVKVAKNSLVSDAKDAISKFQSLLSRVGDDDTTSNSDDDDDDDDDDLDGGFNDL